MESLIECGCDSPYQLINIGCVQQFLIPKISVNHKGNPSVALLLSDKNIVMNGLSREIYICTISI